MFRGSGGRVGVPLPPPPASSSHSPTAVLPQKTSSVSRNTGGRPSGTWRRKTTTNGPREGSARRGDYLPRRQPKRRWLFWNSPSSASPFGGRLWQIPILLLGCGLRCHLF